MSEKIQAVGFRLLVQPDNIEKKTESGILLEYGAKEEFHKMAVTGGTVLTMGPQAYKSADVSPTGEPWCKVGDRVLFGKYNGTWVRDPDNEERQLVVLNDVDVIAILPPKES